MKSIRLWAMLLPVLLFVLIACRHRLVVTEQPGDPNQLTAVLTGTAPVIDGSVDAAWDKATPLTGETEVPNPGNDLFTGYNGDKYRFKLRALYDAQNIYFLAEWNDPSEGKASQPWYFNAATKRWAQESNSRQLDSAGKLVREAIGQDQLAFLWNIDNSTPRFVTQTCYASCHVFSPYTTAAGALVPNRSGNHYTNGPNEKIDMWWLRLNRELPEGQMDDQYQDWSGGPSVTDPVGGAGNGRHPDDMVPPSPYSSTYLNTNPSPQNGPVNNRVSLKLDGTGSSVNVPAWVIPGATNIAYIKGSDTLPGGPARRVVGVSSAGVLTYNGGTLDPTGDAGYAQLPGTAGGVGPKCIPGFLTGPYTGGRSDFSVKGQYTANGWVVEFKRALNTHSTLKQDIDFSSLQDQPFGVAIFNNCNNQHSIKPFLKLTFKK